MSDDALTHETRTDPVGLAAAAHRQRMALLADGALDPAWGDEADPASS